MGSDCDTVDEIVSKVCFWKCIFIAEKNKKEKRGKGESKYRGMCDKFNVVGFVSDGAIFVTLVTIY